jgi:hypothetical protein
MKHFVLLSILTIILFSCQQKADTAKAKQFAQTIHDYTHFQFKASQQEFVDKLTEDLNRMQQNNNAMIDTKKLRELLNKAKQANQVSTEHIKNTTEIDNEINLRRKALDENELFKSLYENEFDKIITAIENKEPDKLNKAIHSLSAREDEIKKVQSASRQADDEFTKKYNISFPEDSTKN